MRGPLKVFVCMVAIVAGMYTAKHWQAHEQVKASATMTAQPAADDRAVRMSAQYWPSSFALQ